MRLKWKLGSRVQTHHKAKLLLHVLGEGWSSEKNLLAIDFCFTDLHFTLSRPSDLKVSL